MVSDLVLRQKLPLSIENRSKAMWAASRGAVMKDVYLDAIGSAGFGDVEVIEETPFSLDFFVSDSTDRQLIRVRNERGRSQRICRLRIQHKVRPSSRDDGGIRTGIWGLEARYPNINSADNFEGYRAPSPSRGSPFCMPQP